MENGPTSALKSDPPGAYLTARGIVVVSWPKLGSRSGCCARLLLLFHRLFEAEAFAIHFEDVAMVSESVQQSRGHAFALEDLAPVAE